MTLRQLFPADQADPDLAALYAYPDGPWLRANMVSSVDGAASLKGASAGLSSDTDRRLFALLRTLSDVIVVGAATVRTERYKPARRQRGLGVTCGRAARRPRRSRWSPGGSTSTRTAR